MGQYNAKIMAEFNPPRKWKLGRDLSYTTEDLTADEVKALKGVGVKIKKAKNSNTITVPEGFITDLASVPRPMWWAIAPFDVARAAIIHDLLYKTIRQYRWKMKDLEVEEDKELIKLAKIASDKVFWLGNGSIIPNENNI